MVEWDIVDAAGVQHSQCNILSFDNNVDNCAAAFAAASDSGLCTASLVFHKGFCFV